MRMSKEQSPPESGTKEQVLLWIKQYQETNDDEAQTNLVLTL